MSRIVNTAMRKSIWVVVIILVVAAAAAFARYRLRGPAGAEVVVENIAARDLEAVVSASGKIRAKKTVNISAETSGKIVNLAVMEGQRVSRGQLLLEIDPRNLETAVQNREANLGSARSQLEQTRAQIESARVSLKQSQDNMRRQDDMWRSGLIPRDTYERAQ